MMSFEARIENLEQENVLTLMGALNENSTLPRFTDKKNIRVNLGQLTHLNSHGTKIWCEWVRTHDHCPLILMEECPHLFVKNFATLKGLVSGNMRFQSFYVPYYSEATFESQQALFALNREFAVDGLLSLPVVYDSEGNKMELDVSKEKYFAFLKPVKPI